MRSRAFYCHRISNTPKPLGVHRTRTAQASHPTPRRPSSLRPIEPQQRSGAGHQILCWILALPSLSPAAPWLRPRLFAGDPNPYSPRHSWSIVLTGQSIPLMVCVTDRPTTSSKTFRQMWLQAPIPSHRGLNLDLLAETSCSPLTAAGQLRGFQKKFLHQNSEERFAPFDLMELTKSCAEAPQSLDFVGVWHGAKTSSIFEYDAFLRGPAYLAVYLISAVGVARLVQEHLRVQRSGRGLFMLEHQVQIPSRGQ